MCLPKTYGLWTELDKIADKRRFHPFIHIRLNKSKQHDSKQSTSPLFMISTCQKKKPHPESCKLSPYRVSITVKPFFLYQAVIRHVYVVKVDVSTWASLMWVDSANNSNLNPTSELPAQRLTPFQGHIYFCPKTAAQRCSLSTGLLSKSDSNQRSEHKQQQQQNKHWNLPI